MKDKANEQEKHRKTIQREHIRMSKLLSSIPSILIVLDENDRVIQWNSTAERIFGIIENTVVGRTFRECCIQWEWDKVIDGISECWEKNQQIRLDDVSFTRTDGKDGLLGITLNPVIERNGKQSGILLFGADITKRKILEEQLRQAQKLESIGQLAAGIAHEINTPIQYISDNIHFLKDVYSDMFKLFEKYSILLNAVREGSISSELLTEVEEVIYEVDIEFLSEEIPMAIEQSLEGINRVDNIVRAMKEFSHPGTKNKIAVDINKAIESTITVARNEWKYVAEVKTDFDPNLPLVPCFADEFNQAILNIIVNAADAIADVVGDGTEGKGIITVSTRLDEEWVEILISDTGTGIPEEARTKVFDPFFTTKDVGKGTGQGLSIVHNVVVEKHNGTITFETEMGKATTFIIRLPITEE